MKIWIDIWIELIFLSCTSLDFFKSQHLLTVFVRVPILFLKKENCPGERFLAFWGGHARRII